MIRELMVNGAKNIPANYAAKVDMVTGMGVQVDHKAGQILKGIQCLSSFSDQDTHILTGKINFKRTVLGIILHLDLKRELHGFEYTD